MADLRDGETHLMQGSAAAPYELKNTGGVYSCNCPAWRNQGAHPTRRTCKHLRKLRGDPAEDARCGSSPPPAAARNRVRAAGAAAGTSSGSTAGAEPPLLLAHSWDQVQDLTGWWMSEKLDGVRAYWDGQQFISRLGNPYLAPAWFTAGLPPTPLDGELWGGRKKFQRTISIVRRQDRGDDWKEIRYLVFDAPAMPNPFEERIEAVRNHLAGSRAAYAEFHAHQTCTSIAQLRTELARVEALGGEGLMLRQPRSTYSVGRSASLLKVKSFFDAEAKVISHQGGAGKHTGRLGALEVEMPNGIRFHVGTGFSDAERRSPPALGSVITYRYQELSDGGVPRFPSFVAVREDLPWPPPEGGNRPPPAPVAPPAPVPPGGQKRCFQRTERGTRNLWELELNGEALVVRSRGADVSPAEQVQRFASSGEAAQAARRLISEKVGEGFEEV